MLFAALTLAPRELGAERVEVRCPESAESADPLVGVAKSASVDGVHASLAVRPYRRETVVSQHLQVLRYRRLRDRELVGDGGADRTCRQFAIGEQFENASPNRDRRGRRTRARLKDIVVAYISQQ